MQEVAKIAQAVKTKEDFLEFVGSLILDLKNNPGNWVNKNLEDYLEALQRWTEDMEGFYLNNNSTIPTNINWKIFTEMLMAASTYE
jgi:hypothetical protein